MKKICLVTPAHLAANPRLVKEADTLAKAGYEVHVVSCRYFPQLDEEDAAIQSMASWSHTCVELTKIKSLAWRKIYIRILRKFRPWRASITLAHAIKSLHPAIPEMVSAVLKTNPDFVIGHCLPGLVAAAQAGQKLNKPWAFDAEDFHSAETTEVENNLKEQLRVQSIESCFLPEASHLTAAAPEIGKAYQKAYALKSSPVTILNVFPRDSFPLHQTAESPSDQPRRLYWFSQTVGRGRGIEQLVEVLALMTTPCSLHLRGFPAANFRQELEDLARQTGFTGAIEWLSFGTPAEMVRLAAGYDLGLSLERSTPRNRDLCLTNKIFTYLGAGIPVGLSSTTAQRALGATLGEAAVMLDFNETAKAAQALDDFFKSPSHRQKARTQARKLGRQTYNWEREQNKLLTLVNDRLPL